MRVDLVRVAHLFFGAELVLAPTPGGEPPRVFSFTPISADALDLIMANMAECDESGLGNCSKNVAQKACTEKENG